MDSPKAPDMNDDSRRTLHEVYGSLSLLVQNMCQIQQYSFTRDDSYFWVQRLRFLDISRIPYWKTPSSRPSRSLRLTQNDEAFENPYVAVSYCWGSPSRQDGRYDYEVVGPRERRPAKVESSVLDRTIRFASSRRVRYIWIDQECLDQIAGSEDMTTGVQSMDLVYKNSCSPVALLDVRITLRDMRFLDQVFYGRVFHNRSHFFRPRVSRTFVANLRRILNHILSDKWWTRTWTFQEEHCSKHGMTILIPCTGAMHQRCNFDFGCTDGEIEISLKELRTAVTKFNIACRKRNYFIIDKLGVARQYNLLNRGRGKDRYSCMTPQLYGDIEARNNSRVCDRVAILANCCDYSTRLDTGRLIEEGYGLSVCILTLLFLNGEIFHNEIPGSVPSRQKVAGMLSSTGHQFFESVCFSKFEPPGEIFKTSFMNHSRFPNVKLCPEGIRTEGWLWELGDTCEITLYDHGSGSCADGAKVFRRYLATSFLRRLRNMGEEKLAEKLSNYLSKEGEALPKSADWFMDKMVEELALAAEKGRTFRLGRLSSDPFGMASAIFINKAGSEVQSGPNLVFTAWSPERDGCLAKFVALGVREDGDSREGLPRLITGSWMNGLWFAHGKRSNYIFPWPF